MALSRHYGRVVKATDSNFDYLFRSPSAGSNPAGVVFVGSQRISACFFLGRLQCFSVQGTGRPGVLVERMLPHYETSSHLLEHLEETHVSPRFDIG